MERQRTGSEGSISQPEAATPAGDTPTGVRRVNNMPLLIIGGVLVVFVILVALVAAQRGEKKVADPAPASGPLPENSQLLEQMLANSGAGGIIPDPDEERVPSFPVARVEDPDVPPLPVASAPVSQDEGTMAKQRMKLFQTAMQAKTTVGQAQNSGASKNDSGGDEKEIAETASSGVNMGQQRPPLVANGDYSKFDRKSTKNNQDRWSLETDVEAPRTAYEIRAGAVIPAVMISGINSDLPGQIVAQVSQDVFDTATGRYRLIPQGSKLVGRYNHNVILGQSRLLVAWQRILLPDGKALDIGAMEGVDSAGYAGFGDKVDRHYVRLFGSAILMSGITSGLTSSRVNPRNDPFGSSTEAKLSQNLAQQIGEVATKMIEQNMNTAPTLKIRPGYRFNVMVVKDLTLDKPYQAFDY